MNPRINKKSAWTSIPQEFAFKVLHAIEKEFPDETQKGEFFVEGRIYAEEIVLRLGYLESGRLRQINLEASVDYDAKTQDFFEQIYVAVDYLGAWMKEVLELQSTDEDLDLPLQWKAVDYQNQTLYIQFNTINSKLEFEADQLLGVDSNALFHEAEESEDAFMEALEDPDLHQSMDSDINLDLEVPNFTKPDDSKLH